MISHGLKTYALKNLVIGFIQNNLASNLFHVGVCPCILLNICSRIQLEIFNFKRGHNTTMYKKKSYKKNQFETCLKHSAEPITNTTSWMTSSACKRNSWNSSPLSGTPVYKIKSQTLVSWKIKKRTWYHKQEINISYKETTQDMQNKEIKQYFPCFKVPEKLEFYKNIYKKSSPVWIKILTCESSNWTSSQSNNINLWMYGLNISLCSFSIFASIYSPKRYQKLKDITAT